MPKCLDCGNATNFSFVESISKTGRYSPTDGMLELVKYETTLSVYDGVCSECTSTKIEGEL